MSLWVTGHLLASLKSYFHERLMMIKGENSYLDRSDRFGAFQMVCDLRCYFLLILGWRERSVQNSFQLKIDWERGLTYWTFEYITLTISPVNNNLTAFQPTLKLQLSSTIPFDLLWVRRAAL